MTGQKMGSKQYKLFVKRFKQVADRESMLAAVSDWFDAGGRAEETFGDQTVFGRLLAANDEALIERALEAFTPWTGFRSRLAIDVAIHAGHAQVLKKILEQGASPLVGRGHVSHIAAAASNNASACFDLLLDHGVSVDDRGGVDQTSLHWAAITGDAGAAAFLLERGADLQAITTSHNLVASGKEPLTALQIARKRKHENVVRLLAAAEEGADSEATSGQYSLRNEIDPKKIRAAVAAVRELPVASTAWFEEEIPASELQTALTTYASIAGDEEPLILVPSVNSGKAGFLLSDKALYFQEAMGSGCVCMPYCEINLVAKDRRYLRLSTDRESLEWDLEKTLLWENSRKKAAELVVAFLQLFLGPQSARTETDIQGEVPLDTGAAAPVSSTDSVAVSVTIEEPILWPRVIAFHLPIVLLGIPLIMPAAYSLIASTGFGGDDLSRGIGRLDYVQLLTLGATSLGPSIYAYGTRLQFSLGRFIPAAALITFASIQALTTAMRIGSGAFPISLGGGLLGIVVASTLGNVGLAVYKLTRRNENEP